MWLNMLNVKVVFAISTFLTSLKRSLWCTLDNYLLQIPSSKVLSFLKVLNAIWTKCTFQNTL